MNHNGRHEDSGTKELWSPTRREFLIRASSAAAIAVGGIAGTPLTTYTAHAAPAPQPDWRFCTNCHGLFFWGENGTYHRENQRCPIGTLHNPDGYNFVLSHDIEVRFTQKDWRFCTNCHGLFFWGENGTYHRENQRCPIGTLHNPDGFNFILPHFIKSLRRAGGMTAEASELLRLINGARIDQGGCAALSVDSQLVDVARSHSQDLAAHFGLDQKTPEGYPGHYGSDGSLPSGPDGRIARAVGSPGTENVFRYRLRGNAAPPTPETAFNAWMQSPPHKANLMDCNHKTTGVGIATSQDPDGWTAYYFTQVFHP